MVRHCLFFVSFFYSIAAFSVPLHSLEAMLPLGSQLALSVYDTKKKSLLVQVGDDILLPPASTLKMVTALAARLYLPKNFTFETAVYLAEKDIVFTFGGDPTLTRHQLNRLVRSIKLKGIKKIQGDIWLDGSAFSGYQRAIGWPWDILGICYSAPSSAMTLEKNCVLGSVYSKKGIALTRAFVPKSQPVTVVSDAQVVTYKQQKERHCNLELHYANNNTYRLSGCLTPRSKPLPLKFAIQNPEKYMADVLAQQLKKAGITLLGEIKIGSIDKDKVLIAKHSSKTRDTLLTSMLKRSDNLIADNLLKVMGHRYYQQSGSFVNGALAIKSILKEKANIDLNHAVIVDGSGLSRNNRMTAAQLMEVITFLHTHPYLGLIEMLPISGVDGTLQYRPSVRYEPLKAAIKAKTGSLFGSYNLAGILKNKKGRDLLVVQFVTNYHIPDTETPIRGRAAPITQFERELFQALHSSSLTTPNDNKKYL